MEEGVTVQATQPGKTPDRTNASKEVKERNLSLTNQPGEPDVASQPIRIRQTKRRIVDDDSDDDI